MKKWKADKEWHMRSRELRILGRAIQRSKHIWDLRDRMGFAMGARVRIVDVTKFMGLPPRPRDAK